MTKFPGFEKEQYPRLHLPEVSKKVAVDLISGADREVMGGNTSALSSPSFFAALEETRFTLELPTLGADEAEFNLVSLDDFRQLEPSGDIADFQVVEFRLRLFSRGAPVVHPVDRQFRRLHDSNDLDFHPPEEYSLITTGSEMPPIMVQSIRALSLTSEVLSDADKHYISDDECAQLIVLLKKLKVNVASHAQYLWDTI